MKTILASRFWKEEKNQGEINLLRNCLQALICIKVYIIIIIILKFHVPLLQS